MLDCQLYGLNPPGHHLTNLLLHAANTLLLFVVLRGATGALWRSAFVAALFAVHPLHVESVAWVAERKDVLSTLFFMLTLWTYVRYAQQKGERRTKEGAEQCDGAFSFLNSPAYWLALLFFTLGLMSKAMLVTGPLVLLLLDYWPLQRFPLRLGFWNTRCTHSASRLILEKLPFLLPSGVCSVVAFVAQRGAGAVATASGFHFVDRVESALISYCRYLGKMFWPANLSVFYPHPGTWPLWQGIGSGVFLLAVSFFVVRYVRQRPYLLVGWLWFLGMLVPVIGVVQVGMQSIADRYTYVPLVGVFIMLTWLTADLTARLPRRAVVLWPAAIVALLVCFIGTRWQLRHWQNTEQLFEHALSVTTNNDVALNALGVVRSHQGKIDEAIAHFRAVLGFRPNHVEALNNLGGELSEQGKLDEALACLKRVIELDPSHASTYNNMGVILTRQGKPAEAVANFQTALRLNPNLPGAHNNLGMAAFDQGKLTEAESHFRAALGTRPDFADAHRNLAMTLAAMGKTDAAVAEYKETLRLKPDLPVVHNKLGSLLLKCGKLEDAKDQFLEAVRLKPDYADAHSNLGLILARQNKLDEAIIQYRVALRCESNHVVAHNNLGLALARQGQLAEAVKHLSEVVRLKPDQAQAHKDLAIALAEQGKFTQALTHFELALKHGADPVEARNNLGRVCVALGRVEAAMGYYREAIRLKPDAVEPLNNLAWLLATHPEARFRNGKEAVKLAERAVELTNRQDAGKLDTLAAAYAEAGRFAEAEATVRQAIALAREAGKTELASEFEGQLKVYRSRKPWREP